MFLGRMVTKSWKGIAKTAIKSHESHFGGSTFHIFSGIVITTSQDRKDNKLSFEVYFVLGKYIHDLQYLRIDQSSMM